MSILSRISGAAFGMHFADQTALVAVPLVALLSFGASPEVIGLLVACQSTAHLLGSLPFGIMVDQFQLRRLALAAALISLSGFGMALAGVLAGAVVVFGLAITFAGFGVVLFSLTALSIVPRAVDPAMFARANAALDVPRAICTFAVPLVIGWIIADIPAWIVFALAIAGAVTALGLALTLPEFEVRPKPAVPVLVRIREGGRYVTGHHLLRPIALCAVCWNLAFAALLVVLLPVIQGYWRYPPGAFGVALSAFGIGAIAGAWVSGRMGGRIAPSVILLFGPGSSALAALGLLGIWPGSPEVWLYLCFFVLGFGPSMWLVAQNSVRQLVSPPEMLGRVNAVIQTAIYGVRPLGAMIGGVVAGQAGPQGGLVLVAGAFVMSFAVAGFSDLRNVASFQSLARPGDRTAVR